MKRAAVMLVLLASLVAGSSVVYADANELKWIARCLEDNASAKVATDVVVKYCTCMTDKMERSETQTVTQWEKTHPAERAACDREAGWK
jgi:hypothetical protein